MTDRTTRTTRIAAAVAVGAMTLGLAACGGDDAGSGTADGPTPVVVWDYLGQGASDTAMKAAIAEFEADNPQYVIERTSFAYSDLAKSIVQGGVGGAVPDVAVVDVVDTQSFAALGLLEDVTADLGASAADFFPGPWSSTQADGRTFGLPLNSNNLALYYNKEYFAAAGVEAPSTWEELRTTAKAVTDSDHNGIAMSAVKNEQGTFQFLPFLWQTGGDLDTFATDGAEALGLLAGLVADGSMSSAVANYSQEDARTQFVTGKTAMMINGPWELQNLEDAGIDYGVAPLPAGVVAATGLGGENVVTFAQGKNVEGGKAFMTYLASAKGAKTYCDASGQLSARVDLAGTLAMSDNPDMKVFEDQLDVAHARVGAKYGEISAAVQEALQLVITGAATPADAAAKAASTITPLLG